MGLCVQPILGKVVHYFRILLSTEQTDPRALTLFIFARQGLQDKALLEKSWTVPENVPPRASSTHESGPPVYPPLVTNRTGPHRHPGRKPANYNPQQAVGCRT